MVNLKTPQVGISLIELMITITLLAILVVTGTAFTAQWAKQAELDKAVMSLRSAMSLAKSIALRNEFATTVSLPASQLCFDSLTKELTVRKASLDTSASCTSSIVSSVFLSNSIEINQSSDNTSFKCFALNNYGQIITEITGNCKANLNITVHNGVLNENLVFN
ncbi:pilus assembly FimT family protein [Acinetobacter guerrae]|uniref:pilus assembly FimT family protein n=1 Tax=Acinetobacter guerrae TaxID=1843371 RepID=UPI00125FFC7C|nr:prepilin-type N-terminal cleavage/methylation domain-containing protein [Acinetobacter guerrae]